MFVFTVIVPTYNSAKTIDKCLQSILSQTYANYEVIVVDGESTDGTQNIVKNYIKGTQVKMISEKDSGIYDAMNKGIAMAKGTWLYFLGSDDELYHENILANVYQTITNNPQSKLVYGDVITTDETVERYQNYRFTDLLSRCICHQSMFYHRSLFKKINYDQQYTVCADWDFNLKVFRRKINPLYMGQIIARFDLSGVSGAWMHHSEYLEHFSNKKEVVKRYRGSLYLYLRYYPFRALQKLKHKLVWIFR
jgi:glycosyltransferase involved in cell wall biosynthesis